MKFTKEKLIAITGVALVVLGEFLPFLTASAYGIKASTSYAKTFDGIVVLLVVLAGLVLFLVSKNKKIAYNAPSSICGFAIALTAYDAFISGGQSKKDLIALGGKVSVNIGFYLIIVGLVLFLLGIFLESKRGNNKELANSTGYSYPNENNDVTYQNVSNNQYTMPNQNTYTQSIPEINTQSVNNNYEQSIEPTNAEQVQPEPVQPIYSEPVQPEPVQPEPVQLEQIQPEQVQPESVQPEPVQTQQMNRFINTDPIETSTDLNNSEEDITDDIFKF